MAPVGRNDVAVYFLVSSQDILIASLRMFAMLVTVRALNGACNGRTQAKCKLAVHNPCDLSVDILRDLEQGQNTEIS